MEDLSKEVLALIAGPSGGLVLAVLMWWRTDKKLEKALAWKDDNVPKIVVALVEATKMNDAVLRVLGARPKEGG
jgi:hypothetical protein